MPEPDPAQAVGRWRSIADEAGVDEAMADQIARSHRLSLPAG